MAVILYYLYLVDKNDSNWMVVHARSVALFIALKECSDALLDQDVHRESVITALLAHSSSDKVCHVQRCYI